MYISIEHLPEGVLKRYHADLAPKGLAEEKFRREVAAYSWFAENDIAYVPKLISHDVEQLLMLVEHAGVPLNHWIADGNQHLWPDVIRQLSSIDQDLYRRRVNYLFSSPADVLVDEDGRVRIIDFEYTEAGCGYEHLLMTAMDNQRLFECDEVAAESFLILVRKAIPTSYRYWWRRLRYSVYGRMGLLREQLIRINE